MKLLKINDLSYTWSSQCSGINKWLLDVYATYEVINKTILRSIGVCRSFSDDLRLLRNQIKTFKMNDDDILLLGHGRVF